jgi:hypothetical protein
MQLQFSVFATLERGWIEEKTGIYTATRKLMDTTPSQTDAPNSSNWDSDGLQGNLWQLKVVPKVGVFFVHQEEALYHALLSCIHAKQFWRVTLDHDTISSSILWR